MPDRTCASCGAPLTSRRPNAKFCGKTCRNRDQRRREKVSGRWQQRRRESYERRRSRPEFECEICGKMFGRPRAGRTPRFCSPECVSEMHRRRGRPRPWPATNIRYVDCSGGCGRIACRPRSDLTRWRCEACPPYDRVWVAGTCQRCGDPFVIEHQAEARYCSRRCAKAAGRSARRARRRGAFVEAVTAARVFERDGWRCQICRRPVRRTAVVPHPLAPTIDHIVPLDAGGSHEMANVQCAHFLCNAKKGNRAANDQLRLIG